MPKKYKNSMDDGFNSELVETAIFDGILEIPQIERPNKFKIPTSMIPFSERNRSADFSECLVFYEQDIQFSDVTRDPKAFLKDFSRFPEITSLDNSVYRDSPLLVQIANVYRSRAIGYYFQKNGLYIIPNVRWGDERSYTSEYLPEKFAFLGLPKHSILSIGTYGCISTKENKFYFKQGLSAMLATLEPEIILVYGRMPDCIFSEFKVKYHFEQYPDRISSMRKKG